MHVREEASAAELLVKTHPLFAGEREVEANLILGILQAVCKGLYLDPPPWLWSVRDDAGIVGVALRTPPFPLAFSPMPDAGCDAVAERLLERELLPLELNGPRPVVERVVHTLRASVALDVEVVTNTRLFGLTQVTPSPPTSGTMRLAYAADHARVYDMFQAFQEEALPHEVGRFDVQARVQRLLESAAGFLWEDADAPVAFAAFGRRVGGGASIGPVYTPPALRGRGYATALVAALSQHLLDSGCSYTSLFTDLANPTSNSIYPKVGYRPVLDMRHLRVRVAE